VFGQLFGSYEDLNQGCNARSVIECKNRGAEGETNLEETWGRKAADLASNSLRENKKPGGGG